MNAESQMTTSTFQSLGNTHHRISTMSYQHITIYHIRRMNISSDINIIISRHHHKSTSSYKHIIIYQHHRMNTLSYINTSSYINIVILTYHHISTSSYYHIIIYEHIIISKSNIHHYILLNTHHHISSNIHHHTLSNIHHHILMNTHHYIYINTSLYPHFTEHNSNFYILQLHIIFTSLNNQSLLLIYYHINSFYHLTHHILNTSFWFDYIMKKSHLISRTNTQSLYEVWNRLKWFKRHFKVSRSG